MINTYQKKDLKNLKLLFSYLYLLITIFKNQHLCYGY